MSSKLKTLLFGLTVSSAWLLNGCYSDAEMQSATKVITALPQEVAGCTFIADVDTNGARAMMEQARLELKIKAAKLGATHLVETFVYPGVLTRSLLGVGLSARAYKCPAGKGPIVENKEVQKKYEIPPYEVFYPDENDAFLR